ncbi:sugar kinase [Roseobacter weihaiensis]|uniref:sugar kinase n=1 Tax=Roseobacter weihaiensis TaxID=2763262 RepID=UPI001D0BE155|nr:sugar kinase [Roseobacter sp. H9]
MTRVAAVGEAMIELSLQGSAAKVGVAGDTLNTAIYLKRSAPQLEVNYFTCLGDDPFSDQIEHFIAEQDIGTGAVTRITGKSPGLYAITTTNDGERSFTYWRSAAAARDLFKTAKGTDFSVLAHYDLVYLSGISVAILPQAVRLELLSWLSGNDIRLAYDSNYRPRLWEDRQTAQEITEAFWRRADICLPSVDDEIALFGGDQNAVTARFQGYGGTGALKRGADGPLSIGEPVTQAYRPAPSVVDTTAAGDSFNGGYLAALLSGASQAEALHAGHACAAHVVQFRGAIVPRQDR